ncbi:hypothetical protein Trydic_g2320 [Trypoxylus dichotomus]
METKKLEHLTFGTVFNVIKSPAEVRVSILKGCGVNVSHILGIYKQNKRRTRAIVSEIVTCCVIISRTSPNPKFAQNIQASLWPTLYGIVKESELLKPCGSSLGI